MAVLCLDFDCRVKCVLDQRHATCPLIRFFTEKDENNFPSFCTNADFFTEKEKRDFLFVVKSI